MSCRSAKIVKGQAPSDEIIRCDVLRSDVTFKVTTCSEYLNRGQPSLWHMEDIAWILRTDAKRGRIGFVRASDLRPHLRHVLEDD